MHYIQQLDMTDCGAVCLAMIASYFRKSLSIAEVHSVAGTDISTNMKGMMTAASSYGLKGKAVEGTKDAVTPPPRTVHCTHAPRAEER